MATVDDAEQTLHVRRLRIGLILLALSIPLFAVADMRTHPELLPAMLPYKAMQFAAVGLTWLALRRPGNEERVTLLSRLAGGFFFVGVAAHAVLRQDVITGAANLLLTLYVEAFLLPVSLAAHFSLAAMAGLAVTGAYYLVYGTLSGLFAVPLLPLWFAGTVAPWVGYELQRSREELHRHRRALETNRDRLVALVAVAQEISGELDVRELLRRVERHVTTALDCDLAGTFTWDARSQAFCQFSTTGLTPELQEAAASIAFAADSPIGRIILRRRPLSAVTGEPGNPVPQELLERFGVTAVAAAPLDVRNRPLGILFACARAPGRRFSESQLDLLHAIARQLALALEVVELFEAEHQRAEENDALARVNREMISSLDTPALLKRLCEVTAAVLRCDYARTIFHNDTDDSFSVAASFGDSPEQQEELRVVRLPRALFGKLVPRLEAGEIVQVSPSDLGDLIPTGLQARLGVTRAMFVPLLPGGKLVGLLIAGFRGHVEPFSEAAQRIATGIARAAALALENARLVAELDRANSIKDDFVATMSHELRSPLNILIGYSDLLLDGTFDPLSPKQREVIERLRQQSGQLLSMINATLDLSRLEAERVRLPASDVDVPALIEELRRETPMANKRPEVEVEWRVDPGLPLLHTDQIKLKVVLTNLIQNALKFTERGKIAVRAEHAEGGVAFVVSDSGIGIAQESQESIFEPFRQADSSILQRFGGTGLGLYIVRRMVELLGGRLALESQAGRGSTFRVWLPVNPKPPPAAGG